MSRLKKASEKDYDKRAVILRAQLLSDAAQKVLISIGECFTVDLVDLHRLYDTQEDFEIELRECHTDKVSQEWEPGHSLAMRYNHGKY